MSQCMILENNHNYYKFPLSHNCAIECQDPSDPNLKERLQSRWMGSYAQYQCKEGFTPTDGQARCTENGWTPNPLCKGIFMGDFY